MDYQVLIKISKVALEDFLKNGDRSSLCRQWKTILYKTLCISRENNNSMLDLAFYLQLMERIIKYNISKEKAEIEYIQTQMSIVSAEMLDAMDRQKSIFGIRGEYMGSKKICYLDQNLFTPYINGEKLNFKISDDYLVAYSPAHIEEISKSPNEFHENELKNISRKLNDLEILFKNDTAIIVYENPLVAYKRVNDGTKSRELAEQYKILQNQLEEKRFGEYRTDKKRQEYNSKNPDTFLFDHMELVNEILCKMQRTYKIEDILKVKGTKDYHVINGYIHDLYMVLDICGVKKDNSERKIRSSRLDIEHLLYASNAQIFVTDDGKLRCRAKNIFSVLGKTIECPEPQKGGALV